MLTTRIIGGKEFTSWLRSLATGRGRALATEALGRAAIITQGAMRTNLDRMIYAQPNTSGYVRTGTLRRSTHAASPSTDHSGDEGRARGGADLAATEPERVVEDRGGMLATEIGSWVKYAEPVHRGYRQPSPRPFMEEAVDEAEQCALRELEQAAKVMAQ